jgi:hypothetical protein
MPVVSPELFAKAAAEGVLRVIVHLRLTPGQEDARHRAIEAARESALREISHTSHRVIRTYEAIPLLALEVSTETLRVLASSPSVGWVEEDSLAAPQSSPSAPPVKPAE